MSGHRERAVSRLTPRRVVTEAELQTWQHRRATSSARASELVEAGQCYQCVDQATGGSVLGEQDVIVETDHAKAVLALDPRAPGHTIVVWKPHRHNFTELDDDETAELFTLAKDVARAIESGLAGVERVYLVTMCDGAVNHLHLQLIPRYAGSPIGSRRLVDERMPLLDGTAIAAAIADALTP